jgi:hypothetical protein
MKTSTDPTGESAPETGPSASPADTTNPLRTASMARVENASAQEEGRFHRYVGHEIPWYVRLIWVLFWCFAAWYVVSLLLPALDTELLAPP